MNKFLLGGVIVILALFVLVLGLRADEGGYLVTDDNTLHFTTLEAIGGTINSHADVNSLAAYVWSGDAITLSNSSYWSNCDSSVIQILVKLIAGISVSTEAANAICKTPIDKLPHLTVMERTDKSLDEWRIEEQIKTIKKDLITKEKELEALQ